jgi:5-methylcytosine-specific restriction endonuclease McrA
MLQEKVLVLNQSYEPLSVCTVRRAVVLLFLGKAEMIVPLDHQYLRSVHTIFPVPSIVRLLLHKKVPVKKIILSRKNVLMRDNFQCQYCGRKNVPLTVDHVIPRDRGGEINWENLVCACVKCNNKKGNRSPEEADMTLFKNPRKPNHITFLRFFVETVNDDWKPYLFIED